MLPPPQSPAPGQTWSGMMQQQQPFLGQEGGYYTGPEQLPYIAQQQTYQEPMQPLQPQAQAQQPLGFLNSLFPGRGRAAQQAAPMADTSRVRCACSPIFSL